MNWKWRRPAEGQSDLGLISMKLGDAADLRRGTMTDEEIIQLLYKFEFLVMRSKTKNRVKRARKLLCDLRAALNEMELLDTKHYKEKS